MTTEHKPHSERLRELLSRQPEGEGAVILSEDECLYALDDLRSLIEQLEVLQRQHDLWKLAAFNAKSKPLGQNSASGVDKDGHAHLEPRWNLREIELWMAALGFLPEQKEQLVSALTSGVTGGGSARPTRAPEESSPASSPLCECGHSRENHHGDPMTVAKSPCRATVYTEAPLGGGNAFTCHCRDYVPASEPDTEPRPIRVTGVKNPRGETTIRHDLREGYNQESKP